MESMESVVIYFDEVFYEMSIPDWAMPPLESELGLFANEIAEVIDGQIDWAAAQVIGGFDGGDFSFMTDNRGDIMADVLNDNIDVINAAIEEAIAGEFMGAAVDTATGGLAGMFDAVADFFLGE